MDPVRNNKQLFGKTKNWITQRLGFLCERGTFSKISNGVDGNRQASGTSKLVNDSMRFLGMFFFPVGVENNSSKHDNKNQNSDKKKKEIIHNYSPLSIIVAKIKQIAKISNPTMKILGTNSLPETNCPNTNAINTNLPTSKNALARFSFCRLVSFITLNTIITKMLAFVKPVKEKFETHHLLQNIQETSNGAEGRFFVKSLSRIFRKVRGQDLTPIVTLIAQEIDIKTKIKEWFDILTIPSEVEGLKHKDTVVRILGIQTLWKVEKEG